MRALPVAVTLVGQARRGRAIRTSARRPIQEPGLSGRDAVLTIIGRHNARKLPDCGMPARGQVIDLAGAKVPGIGTVILIRDHDYRRSPNPADCDPEVYDAHSGSAWTPGPASRLAGLGGIVLAS